MERTFYHNLGAEEAYRRFDAAVEQYQGHWLMQNLQINREPLYSLSGRVEILRRVVEGSAIFREDTVVVSVRLPSIMRKFQKKVEGKLENLLQ